MITTSVFRASRKVVTMLLICAMLLGLTACGVTPTSEATTNQTPTPIAAPSATKSPSEEYDHPAESKNVPSITEVVSDYLTESGQLTDYYTDLGLGWIDVRYDVELGSPSSRICPTAVFPDEEWTPATVLQSYLDKTVNWEHSTDPVTSPRYYLWSADFDYLFTIEDGWLSVNYTESLPFDCETRSDLSPLALLKEYQAGIWNGEELLWSEDYSTYVKRWGDGTLKYFYHNPMAYDEPGEFAYAGAAEKPWWDGLEEIQGFSIEDEENGVAYRYAVVDCYLDLPGGVLDESAIGSLVRFTRSDTGDWFTTKTGVYHYLRGKLLDSWQLQMDSENQFIVARESWNDFPADYAYDGKQLVELLPGGKTKVLFDNVFAETNHEYTLWAYFLEDGSLKRWWNHNGDITIDNFVEKDVVRTSGANSVFFEKADGYVYTFGDPYYYHTVTPTCVGRGTLDYYVGKWTEFCDAGHYDRDEFITTYGEPGGPKSEYRQINVANAIFGQRVLIKDGAAYYASADHNGSGVSAQVYNAYTMGDLYLGGFSVVKDDHLSDHEAYLRDDIRYGQPAPSFCQNADGNAWCFIYTDGFTTGSIGWFSADDVYYVQPDNSAVVALPEKDTNPDDGIGAKDPTADPYRDYEQNGYYDEPAIGPTNQPVFEDRAETTSDEVASNIEELTTSGERVAVLLDASGSVKNYSAAIANYAAQVDTADTVIMFGGSAKTITADTYSKESSRLGWNFPLFGSSGNTNIFVALNSIPAGEYNTVILVSDLLSRNSSLTERTDIGNVVIIYVGDADDMSNLDKQAQHVIDEITEKWNVVPVIQQLVTE